MTAAPPALALAPLALGLAPWALPMLAGSGLYAAWSDLRHRRLPNWLAGLVAASGLAVTAGQSGPAPAASATLHALAAFLIGLAIYSRGAIGGGDIKYYAAVAAWFPLSLALRLLGWVSLAGLVLALGWLIWQRLAGQRLAGTSGREAPNDHDKLPFGVAIAAGALLAAFSA